MNYLLRTMQTADLPQIVAIEQEQAFPWTETQLRECLDAGDECLVVEGEQGIAGFSILRVAGEESEILNIAVKSSSRRKGYGKKLLESILAIAKSRGAKVVFLEVRVSNWPARKLYTSHGFQQVGMRKDYYRVQEGSEDAIILRYSV